MEEYYATPKRKNSSLTKSYPKEAFVRSLEEFMLELNKDRKEFIVEYPEDYYDKSKYAIVTEDCRAFIDLNSKTILDREEFDTNSVETNMFTNVEISDSDLDLNLEGLDSIEELNLLEDMERTEQEETEEVFDNTNYFNSDVVMIGEFEEEEIKEEDLQKSYDDLSSNVWINKDGINIEVTKMSNKEIDNLTNYLKSISTDKQVIGSTPIVYIDGRNTLKQDFYIINPDIRELRNIIDKEELCKIV